MPTGALEISLGAVLLIAAVAGFVIVPEHAPATSFYAVSGFGDSTGSGSCPANIIGRCRTQVTGLPQSAYDALRIATWAALITGALLIIIGLINYSRRPARA